MGKFSLNPLKWFDKKQRPKAPPRPGSPALLKSPAKPRKSGNIFMHLINIQKSLKSMELAMRQQIDFSWLLQKVTGQMSVLKLEAETMGEEELAALAGQVEAYFETVAEGRLDFDEGGLIIMLEFTNIFKEALGDAVSEVSSPDPRRVEAWNTCYQALMAQMKPSVEEVPSEPAAPQDEDVGVEAPEELSPEPEEEVAHHKPDFAGAADSNGEETSFDPETLAEFQKSPALDPFADSSDAVDEALGVGAVEAVPDDDIPFYDPEDKIQVRDVVISDAEIRSAREYMEAGESRPEVTEPEEPSKESDVEPDIPDLPPQETEDGRITPDKSPVQLQEVERLKAKLGKLHEKQEMLSTRMSGILVDYRKAVEAEPRTQDSPTPEELDLEDLENLIFIGRQKG